MKAVILAGGMGKRLESEKYDLPKALRRAADRHLLEYVLENTDFITQEDRIIVVGYKKEMIMDRIKGDYVFVTQEKQLGTGHAVMMAADALGDYEGDVLVLYGDMPLFRRSTLEEFAAVHRKSNSLCTVMTAVVDDPPEYGRIIRNENGGLVDIIETKDCTEEQLNMNEINVGAYIFNSKILFDNIHKLKNNNVKGEYYITGMPKVLLDEGIEVNLYKISDCDEIYGANTIQDLDLIEKVLKSRVINKF